VAEDLQETQEIRELEELVVPGDLLVMLVMLDQQKSHLIIPQQE
jgi:hypothetical protein